ncbi:FAD binding domain-containing protein [Vallitalea pronyensis]|uniref:FAD binding domain-containing protein n=1 Tax=Vallitalea pronyensis TaxID=1348613 RepID=A0A8J8MHD3_9FIRM|nr:FAD binding domain-containing protein [Vallitalea pronyensis]QUI21348.1 FAD binding domain-containing protein [Vallitalea pronyensis]
MIGFSFDYYVCDTIEEAVDLYGLLSLNGKRVLYFNGGTEILTFADKNRIEFDAVIAVNQIPELKIFTLDDDALYIGAANTLTFIANTDVFPLLSDSCPFVADHTSRNKITIGGNLCGKIPFKNAVIPFFISDTTVIIANQEGIRNEPFLEVYNNGLHLQPGDLIVQFIIPRRVLNLPYYTQKLRKIGEFGYPLIGLSLVKDQGKLKAAFSAVCKNAFRSRQVEDALNDDTLPLNKRVDRAIHNIPCSIVSNLQGSAPYKKFVLKQQLVEALTQLEGE